MIIIENDEALREIFVTLSKAKFLCMDTEFVRRVTYFAKLSLVQISSSDGDQIIIDALKVKDLSPLKLLLLNPQILKIFHAANQDLEIFFHLFKCLPKNIFDTQIATKVCNFGASISYAELCHKFCGVSINKGCQQADWLKRPLKAEFLEYAINDVIHLKTIYQTLSNMISINNLSEKYQQAMNEILDEKSYCIAPEFAWHKVKFDNSNLNILSRMKMIAAVREECAVKLDMPRRHVASDQDLLQLCTHLPTNYNALKKMNLEKNVLQNNKIYSNKLMNLCSGLKGAIT
jgi:ribonuclease D